MTLYISLRLSLRGISLCEGNLGSTVQTLSSLVGTLTAGPWIHRCLPEGKATSFIYINGTHKDISLNSKALRQASSGGIWLNLKPLPKALHVVQIQYLPSKLLHMLSALNTLWRTSWFALVYFDLDIERNNSLLVH